MNGTGLARYDAMCTAIAECVRVDEAKDIRDKALALEKYMAQAENLEAERQACNVRLRAERRCGEILKAMKANGERASRGNPSGKTNVERNDITLADLNISRDQASRFQQLADVPEAEFEAALESPGKPSTSGILKRNKPANVDPMDPNALWLWGRLRDFERQIIGCDAALLVGNMTPAMRDDVRRLAPRVAQWLKGI